MYNLYTDARLHFIIICNKREACTNEKCFKSLNLKRMQKDNSIDMWIKCLSVSLYIMRWHEEDDDYTENSDGFNVIISLVKNTFKIVFK